MIDNVIVDGRQTGRTTKLIKLCAEAEANGEVSYIVCLSHTEAYRIAQQAKSMGLSMGFPITYDEFIRSAGHRSFIKNFYMDNVEFLLQMLAGPTKVAGITLETTIANG